MELRHSAVLSKTAREFLDAMQKRDASTYIKEGNVFRRDPTSGTLEALGPLYANIPEKCRECEFLIKDPLGVDSLADGYGGELFYKGGCVLRDCVEDIIRQKRAYVVSSHQLSEKGKEMLRSAWASRREAP